MMTLFETGIRASELIGKADFSMLLFNMSNLASMLLIFGQYLFFGGGFGEEFGWRGYLLPKLNDRLKAYVTTLIIGLIWSLWHIPAFFLGGDNNGPSLIQFIFFVFSASFFLTWLYYETGQIILLVAIFMRHSMHQMIGLRCFLKLRK